MQIDAYCPDNTLDSLTAKQGWGRSLNYCQSPSPPVHVPGGPAGPVQSPNLSNHKFPVPVPVTVPQPRMKYRYFSAKPLLSNIMCMSVRDSKVELTSFPHLDPSLSKLYQYLNYLVWAGGNLNVPGTLPCPRTGVPGPVLCLERWTSSPLQVPNFRGLVWTAGTVPPVLPIPGLTNAPYS